MDKKTQLGFLLFFIGFIVIAPLSISLDEIMGNKVSHVGLYQYIGAVLGYMISGLGFALLRGEKSKTLLFIAYTLWVGGAIIAFISFYADSLGIGNTPAFERFQLIGTIFGLLLIGGGFIFYFLKRKEDKI